MVIAVHISSTLLVASQLFQSIKFLAEQHPGTRFIIFRAGLLLQEPVPANIEFIPVKRQAGNLSTHFWYNYRLPSLLQQIKADVFISEAGIASLKTKLPQWLWVSNTAFLYKRGMRHSALDAYQRKNFPRFLQMASGVLLTAAYMAEQIRNYYPSPANRYHAVGEYFYQGLKPLEWEVKNEVLEAVSGGTEYFYCECNAFTRGHMITVLKAFSLFKKRLKSGLKLVIRLQNILLQDCVKDFHLYKYRQDVIVAADPSVYEPGQWIAAAYAVIFLPSQTTGGNDGLQAFACAVPLITTDTPEHRSLYKDAALYSELNEQSIADHMMLLYKDENKRNEFIQKGLELSISNTLPAVAERLWQVMGK